MHGVQLKDIHFRISELKRVAKILEHADEPLTETEIAEKVGHTQGYVNKILQKCRSLLKTAPRVGNKLSAEGRDLRDSLNAIASAATEIIGETRFGSPIIRVGSIPSILASFLPTVLAKLADLGFFHDYPEAAIQFESYPASELFDRLERGMLDLVIEYPYGSSDIPDDGWSPVKMSRWIQSGDVYQHRLFQSQPVGLLFHASNEKMLRIMRRPASFTFDILRRMVVLLTSDPTQPAFETEFHKCLPEPEAKVGTRIQFQTFSQIRACLLHPSSSFQPKAVGLGVRPAEERDTSAGKKAAKKKELDLHFLDFSTILNKLDNDSPDYQSVRHLAGLSVQTFHAFAKKTGPHAIPRTGALQMFVDTVLKAAKGYSHAYTA